MCVGVIFYRANVHKLSGLESPFNWWSFWFEFESLSEEFDTSCILNVRWCHWDCSVHMNFSLEGERVISEPLLRIERHIKLCLLSLILVKVPFWWFTMDSVDSIRVPIVRKWISNKLCFLYVDLVARCETTFSVRQSHESFHIVVFEVNGQHNLWLQVSGWFIDVRWGKYRVLVIEHFNLVLSELVAPDKSVNVHGIPLDIVSWVVHDFGLGEGGCVQGVFVDKNGLLGAGSTVALKLVRVILISGLTLSWVYETDSLDLYLGRTIRWQ